MGLITYIYLGITAILSFICIRQLLKAKNIWDAICIGFLAVPFVLRTLLIK